MTVFTGNDAVAWKSNGKCVQNRFRKNTTSEWYASWPIWRTDRRILVLSGWVPTTGKTTNSRRDERSRLPTCNNDAFAWTTAGRPSDDVDKQRSVRQLDNEDRCERLRYRASSTAGARHDNTTDTATDDYDDGVRHVDGNDVATIITIIIEITRDNDNNNIFAIGARGFASV